jgi:flavin-dependent dehydrogenase
LPHKLNSYDVVTLGGGLAGLTLALQVKGRIPKARILVLEKRVGDAPEAAFKVGESSVEIAAFYFAEVLGLREHIKNEQLPKLGLRFFFGSGDNSKIENRLELGGQRLPPTPSYQLDRGRFENYLIDRCRGLGIEVVQGARVNDVDLKKGSSLHAVSYEEKGTNHSVSARWIADASGRAAIIKRKLKLQKESKHQANAVWFRVDEKIDVNSWCDSPEWLEGHEGDTSRWFSTNHLMGKGYWVWLIPLASGSTSIGIVADPEIHPLSTYNSQEKALEWLRVHEPQCAKEVEMRKSKIQDFKALKNYSMEAKQVFSHKRWGLIGEAGMFLDPFYSPGSDFIAFGNTFLTSLIERDLQGKSNLYNAFYYDKLYKTFFHGTGVVYRDQYPLFGNHQVMPVKIMWDYMIYWTLTSYLFFHGRTCETLIYIRHTPQLKRINELNRFMQAYFRQWDKERESVEVSGRINMSKIELIYETNRALGDTLNRREFSARFVQNANTVERLFWEIIDTVNLETAVPFKRKASMAEKKCFASIFASSSPTAGDSQPGSRSRRAA